MKSIFEEMGGTYRQEGDYLIPNIKLPEQEEYQLGKYGRMRRNFLKEHHPARYSDLIVEGRLWNHLAEIDKLCNARMEVMIAAMKKTGRSRRSPESGRPDGMGAPYEQHP